MASHLMILIAGPYRSGTNDDPVLIERNVEAMEEMALQVFRRGHLPVLGEWFALPLVKIGGPSTGADDMVATGRRLGKTIFNTLEEIPERKR